MAKELGGTYAWIYGTGHELQNLIHGGPLSESQMDLQNNAEGRAAAKGNRPIDPKNLQKSPPNGGDGSGSSDNGSGICPVDPPDWGSPPPSGCTFVPNPSGGYTVVCPQYH